MNLHAISVLMDSTLNPTKLAVSVVAAKSLIVGNAVSVVHLGNSPAKPAIQNTITMDRYVLPA
jgi:hypothetical protein